MPLALGKLWEPAEDEIVRANYPRRRAHAKLRRLLPHRTWGAIKQRAGVLGLATLHRVWTARERAYVEANWQVVGVAAIALALRRTRCAIVQYAKELGLPFGIPQGCLSIEQAAKRQSYERSVLRKILQREGVAFHPWQGFRGRGKSPRYYVDEVEMLEALERHERRVHSTETIKGAARARGLCHQMLGRWLYEAGAAPADQRGRPHEIPSEVIDRVIAERRAKYPPRKRAA
jgi:hypothetical protein